MSDSSRRGFLILAGAGAAAVGAAAVAPAASASGKGDDGGPSTVEGPLVAYVSNVGQGDLSVMMGEREVVVHDPALCESLAKTLR